MTAYAEAPAAWIRSAFYNYRPWQLGRGSSLKAFEECAVIRGDSDLRSTQLSELSKTYFYHI